MSATKVCILDYGSGNIRSVYNVISYLGHDVVVSNQQDEIAKSTHVILPGVGAFGSSMDRIKRKIPLDVLEDQIIKYQKPFLGICIGMQVLADVGLEFGEHHGLGWIPGIVQKLNSEGLPLPHIGWNDIRIKNASNLLNGLAVAQDFYFVNSYAFVPDDEKNAIAETEYGRWFTSIVQKGNIFGVQFHPEKSQKAGQLLLKNFLEIG